VELPLDDGRDYVRLELEGDGVEVLGVRRLDRSGPESYWATRVRVTAPLGRAPFVLRPYTAAGDSIEYRQSFTVVPPPEADPFPWGLVLAGSATAAGLAAGGLLLARRRAA
jgi:hypothetical protein